MTDYLPQIMETMNDGLFLVGPEGLILLVNRSLEELTGFDKAELIGQPCDMFLCDACPESPTGTGAGDGCGLLNGRHHGPHKRRCTIAAKDGARIQVMKTSSTLTNSQGEVVGVIETIADLSELTKRDQLIEELSRLASRPLGFVSLLGHGQTIRRLRLQIEKTARSEEPILVTGPSGVWKWQAVEAIHALSLRGDGPLVRINCASIDRSDLDRELFGQARNNGTGRPYTGRIEAAHGGRVFLEEIEHLPLVCQLKLSRFLRTGLVERVGQDHGPETGAPVDALVIASVNCDLSALVRRKQFRKELLDQISAVTLDIPSLADHIEDLPRLVEAMISRINRRTGKRITGLSRRALELCQTHIWPGNLRELEATLDYGALTLDEGLIHAEHLPSTMLDQPVDDSPDQEDNPEKTALVAALKKAHGNQSQAARILGVSRVTIWNRMKKYRVDLKKVIQD